MSNVSFVKAIIPSDKYQEIEPKGDRVIVHLNPTESDDCVTCIECSVPAEGFSSEEVKVMCEKWNAEQQAKELSRAKQQKIAEVVKYDKSSAVNEFFFNDQPAWIDRELRTSLMNSTKIAKSLGEKDTSLWFDGKQFKVDCDLAIQLLSSLEMYALQCFNVTESHKKAIEELDGIEEVEAYDIKAGYPDKLKLTIS